MDQIISVIRRCLPLCFPLPESEDQNDASQVVGVEDQKEDEEAAEATAGVEDDDDVAFQANKEALVMVIAICEIASMNDGCQWGICGVTSPTKEYPFPVHSYGCIVDPDCPVWKVVWRCSEDMSILITTYYGTHNHPLPVGSITAMASAASEDFFRLLDSKNPISKGTSSFTQASLPYYMIDPNDPYEGIVLYLTIDSYDPPQFPMPKSPVRDQDQNQPPKILVGKDSRKDDAPQNLVENSSESQICILKFSRREKQRDPFERLIEIFHFHYGLVLGHNGSEIQSNSTTTTTSFSRPHCNYDVFLSFRGEDTRKSFTDHLYSALVQLGIRTFRDDEELPRGKTISTELLNVIRVSKISIVIFSEGYASSRWCLDELVEIVHCKNTKGQTLFPIFYHVDPSDVRNQTGTFAKAFAWHEVQSQTDMERVQRWREALTDAANCSGWELKCIANGYESSFIKEYIIEEILCKVNPNRLNVAKYPIGMKSRVQDIKDLLNLGTSDVRIVGIYGMGGIGKTTLAKAVYNEICVVFEGSSFLSNFKESTEKPDGLLHLQEQLLNDILRRNFKIDNVDRGIIIIEERIRGKKVLVIVDDVDDFEKLHWLVEKEWLGPGSRIIVTSRDEHVLSPLRVDEKYKVRKLNQMEALRLFSWHAFKMADPKQDYLELSIQALGYAGGIPLALVVLGSFLKDRSVAEWKSELERLRSTPDDKIQKILRISFDSLKSPINDIFLDIACFFVGMDKEYAIKVLDGCNFSPRIGIPILIQRSLVTVDFQNKLMMHNLIRDMGMEIVRQESPKYPEERSRLCLHEDVLNVLHNHTGSKRVEGLIFNLLVLDDEHLKTEAFTNMKNLRLLQINSIHLKGSYEHLSKELKWLCWHNCPLEFLPQNFHLENLVILDMQHSNVKQVWKKKKIFNKLKVLNLSNSKYLTKSPDLSEVPQLEILLLEGCTSLVQVHESIGYLKRLVLLNLRKCKNLRNLPSSICKLESLETFVLSECFNLKKFPENLGCMMALTVLHMENTAIKQLPSSFSNLKNLETLSLRGSECLIKSPEFVQTSRLKKLVLEGCTSLVEVHKSIGVLKILKELNLRGCKKLRNLPSSISNLKLLETLVLSDCLELDKLPEKLGNMKALKTLLAGKTTIEQRPSSSLSLRRNPASISSSWISPKSSNHISLLPSIFELCSLTNVRQLDLSGRNLSEDEFPIEFGLLSSLKILDLSKNNFCNLPDCIHYLPGLFELNLNECNTLQSIIVPLSVQVFGTLRANDCTSLERIITLTIRCFFLNNCNKLVEIQSLESLQPGACLHMGMCNNLSPAFRESVLQMMCKAYRGSICLPGSEIPNWFSHQADEDFSVCLSGSNLPFWLGHTMGMGWCNCRTISLISFRVPSFWNGKIGKMLFCVVFAPKKEAPSELSRVGIFNWNLRNKTRTHQMEYLIGSIAHRSVGSCEDHIFVQAAVDRQVSGFEMKSGDEIELSVQHLSISMDQSEELEGEIQVKKCGIHLVDDPNVMDTSGYEIRRFFVDKEFPIYVGHNEVTTIPLSELFDEAKANVRQHNSPEI